MEPKCASPHTAGTCKTPSAALLKRERTEKLVETTERIPDFVYVLLFLGTLGVGATLSTTADNPLYFAVGAGALVVLVGLYLLRTRK